MRANLHYPASPWRLCQLASRWGTSQSQSPELVSDLLITIRTFTKKNSLAIYCFSSVTLGLEFCICRCLFSRMFLQLYLRLVAYSLCISVSLCNITVFSQYFMPKFNLAPLLVYSVFSIWVCCIANYFSMFFSFINSVSCTGDCAPFRTEMVMLLNSKSSSWIWIKVANKVQNCNLNLMKQNSN